jgi:hypothetical protein
MMSVVQMQKKALYSLCIAIAALFMVSGCAAKYTIKTESISGKVVDAETNEPIEDVIVIGYWPGFTFYFERNFVGPIELVEVITDKEGNYFFPGWIKKNLDNSFRYGDPQMFFYKTGYEIEIVKNAFTMENFKQMPGYFHPWRAEWDGKKIKMKKFEGNNRAYREHLEGVHYSVNFRSMFIRCKYMNVPNLLITMEEYYQTQPDYEEPGKSISVADTFMTGTYRGSGKNQKSLDADKPSNLEILDLQIKPLPSILTITQLENIGSRCEETPIEFLKRITSNEKDFIRSSEHDITTNK